jgi:hypothetical protein
MVRMINHDASQYSMARREKYGTAGYSTVQQGTAQYSMVQHDTAWYSKVQHGSAQYSMQGTAWDTTVQHSMYTVLHGQ